MVTVQVQGEIKDDPFTTARCNICSWPTDSPGCSPECTKQMTRFDEKFSDDVWHSSRIQLPKLHLG